MFVALEVGSSGLTAAGQHGPRTAGDTWWNGRSTMSPGDLADAPRGHGIPLP